jgi:hypothetical protein
MSENLNYLKLGKVEQKYDKILFEKLTYLKALGLIKTKVKKSKSSITYSIVTIEFKNKNFDILVRVAYNPLTHFSTFYFVDLKNDLSSLQVFCNIMKSLHNNTLK